MAPALSLSALINIFWTGTGTFYIEDGAEKHAKGKNPKLYQRIRNEWRLTTAERKRILLNNIYGVDIDLQAVEVTKLSLLLKVLEGESDQTSIIF